MCLFKRCKMAKLLGIKLTRPKWTSLGGTELITGWQLPVMSVVCWHWAPVCCLRCEIDHYKTCFLCQCADLTCCSAAWSGYCFTVDLDRSSNVIICACCCSDLCSLQPVQVHLLNETKHSLTIVYRLNGNCEWHRAICDTTMPFGTVPRARESTPPYTCNKIR